MYKPTTSCPKCGGLMKFHWEEGEKSSGMDIRPLRPSGMKNTCITCGYSELEQDKKELA